jgi:hypothetical protein
VKISVMRRGFALVPCTDEDRDAIQGLKAGETYRFEFKWHRNARFHRKYWALMAVVAQYHDVFDTSEKAHEATKIAAGYVDWLPNPSTGEMYPRTKSIAFDRMEEGQFRTFYSNAIDGILKHILPQLDAQALEQAVSEVIGFA